MLWETLIKQVKKKKMIVNVNDAICNVAFLFFFISWDREDLIGKRYGLDIYWEVYPMKMVEWKMKYVGKHIQ